MRKLLVSLAAAGTALAFATPAAAQYYPQPQPGYGQQYGYGYHNNYGQVRALQARIDGLQGQLDQLRARRLISGSEYRDLHADSHRLEYRLRAAASYGLDPREAYGIQAGIARLEHRIWREARNGRYGGYGDYHGDGDYHGYGNYSGSYDRDRDGRDDRYENDHGWDHDD